MGSALFFTRANSCADYETSRGPGALLLQTGSARGELSSRNNKLRQPIQSVALERVLSFVYVEFWANTRQTCPKLRFAEIVQVSGGEMAKT